jgi:hypothetical protein
MKKRKRLLLLVLAFILMAQCIAISASAVSTTAELDSRYWPPRADLLEAQEKNDHRGIIEAVQKVYDIFVGSANPDEIADLWLNNGDVELNIITPYCLYAGEAAEALGDVDLMLKWYKLYLIFIERQKWTWIESRRINQDTFLTAAIKTKIAAYTVEISLFTEIPLDNTSNPFTNAKYEPRNGVLYGSAGPYDILGRIEGNPMIESNPKTPSGVLFYVIFKNEKISDYDWALRELAGKSDIISIAWNFDYKSMPLQNAVNETDLIREEADYLASLGTPVFLRVAAEMNVWNPPANAEDFKAFYIAVADIMRERAPNVAMLFSVNDISAYGVSIMDYYPGDEYVDWVGISQYYQYYHMGNKNAADVDRAIYMTAEFANPVRKMKEIVDLFGGKKPIMLSEYGVAHYINTLGESVVPWAKYRLTQILNYAPMFYPEIKAMFYFDVVRPAEANDYTLRNSLELNQLYNNLTDNGVYLAKGQNQPEFIYAKIDENGKLMQAKNVVINAYAEVINFPELTVEYSVGGTQYASSNQIPYRAVLDLSGLPDGRHSLTVTVRTAADSRVRARKSIQAIKIRDNIILADSVNNYIAAPTASTVIVDGKVTAFDAYTINGYNYFKLRDLAYAINGTQKQFAVEWDEINRAISLISGKPYVSVAGDMTIKEIKETKIPVPTAFPIYLDGEETQFTAYSIDGNNYLKLRDVMRAFDVYVGWDDAARTITLDTSNSYVEP